jgi:hypothetical protein
MCDDQQNYFNNLIDCLNDVEAGQFVPDKK